MKTKAKKRRGAPAPRTAAQRRSVRMTVVDSPYQGIEKVQRVVDTVSALKSRRLISERQVRAAERYGAAFNIVATASSGEIGVGGGGVRTTLSELKLVAAQDINDADRVLGLRDAALMRRVVGEGHSIVDVCGTGATEAEQRHVGRRFREALETLADHWFPAATNVARHRIRASRGPKLKVAPGSSAATIERGRVAFGTADRVGYYPASLEKGD